MYFNRTLLERTRLVCKYLILILSIDMTYSFSNSVKTLSKVKPVLHILLVILFILSACSSFKVSRKEKKPVQTIKSDYRIVKKENRYTQTHMIRQKSNGFFVQFEQERRSVDMDIIISSLKVPYLRVSYYGTEPLSIPSGQTLTFNVNGSEIKLSSKRQSNRFAAKSNRFQLSIRLQSNQ